MDQARGQKSDLKGLSYSLADTYISGPRINVIAFSSLSYAACKYVCD